MAHVAKKFKCGSRPPTHRSSKLDLSVVPGPPVNGLVVTVALTRPMGHGIPEPN